jgi:hypothetical protein
MCVVWLMGYRVCVYMVVLGRPFIGRLSSFDFSHFFNLLLPLVPLHVLFLLVFLENVDF